MTEIIIVELTPEQIEERAIWEAGQHQRDIDAVTEARRTAYQLESDPIFFQWQRGESYTEQDWKDKVAEIDARLPYPAAPKK